MEPSCGTSCLRSIVRICVQACAQHREGAWGSDGQETGALGAPAMLHGMPAPLTSLPLCQPLTQAVAEAGSDSSCASPHHEVPPSPVASTHKRGGGMPNCKASIFVDPVRPHSKLGKHDQHRESSLLAPLFCGRLVQTSASAVAGKYMSLNQASRTQTSALMRARALNVHWKNVMNRASMPWRTSLQTQVAPFLPH